MEIISYFAFDGNCQEAINFYKDIFNSPEPKIMRFKDMPPNPEYPVPQEAQNLVLHGELKIGDNLIYFSDNFPGMPFNKVSGDVITIAIGKIDDKKAIELFNKLKHGGKEIMPIEKTFWSSAYGMVCDKFGIKWQISAEE